MITTAVKHQAPAAHRLLMDKAVQSNCRICTFFLQLFEKSATRPCLLPIIDGASVLISASDFQESSWSAAWLWYGPAAGSHSVALLVFWTGQAELFGATKDLLKRLPLSRNCFTCHIRAQWQLWLTDWCCWIKSFWFDRQHLQLAACSLSETDLQWPYLRFGSYLSHDVTCFYCRISLPSCSPEECCCSDSPFFSHAACWVCSSPWYLCLVE